MSVINHDHQDRPQRRQTSDDAGGSAVTGSPARRHCQTTLACLQARMRPRPRPERCTAGEYSNAVGQRRRTVAAIADRPL